MRAGRGACAPSARTRARGRATWRRSCRAGSASSLDDVAVVDVDRHAAELQRGEERLEVLGPVGRGRWRPGRPAQSGLGLRGPGQPARPVRRSRPTCIGGRRTPARRGRDDGGDPVPDRREVPVRHVRDATAGRSARSQADQGMIRGPGGRSRGVPCSSTTTRGASRQRVRPRGPLRRARGRARARVELAGHRHGRFRRRHRPHGAPPPRAGPRSTDTQLPVPVRPGRHPPGPVAPTAPSPSSRREQRRQLREAARRVASPP